VKVLSKVQFDWQIGVEDGIQNTLFSSFWREQKWRHCFVRKEVKMLEL
jgi:hypothetical protein